MKFSLTLLAAALVASANAFVPAPAFGVQRSSQVRWREERSDDENVIYLFEIFEIQRSRLASVPTLNTAFTPTQF